MLKWPLEKSKINNIDKRDTHREKELLFLMVFCSIRDAALATAQLIRALARVAIREKYY